MGRAGGAAHNLVPFISQGRDLHFLQMPQAEDGGAHSALLPDTACGAAGHLPQGWALLSSPEAAGKGKALSPHLLPSSGAAMSLLGVAGGITLRVGKMTWEERPATPTARPTAPSPGAGPGPPHARLLPRGDR